MSSGSAETRQRDDSWLRSEMRRECPFLQVLRTLKLEPPSQKCLDILLEIERQASEAAGGARSAAPVRGRPLRVGTDGSGTEAPVQALQNLGVSFEHVFASDKDKHARATIEANFKPSRISEDVLQRDHLQAPGCDLYVAGFPCQPLSAAGKQESFEDSRSFVFLRHRRVLACPQAACRNLGKCAETHEHRRGSCFH